MIERRDFGDLGILRIGVLGNSDMGTLQCLCEKDNIWGTLQSYADCFQKYGNYLCQTCKAENGGEFPRHKHGESIVLILLVLLIMITVN